MRKTLKRRIQSKKKQLIENFKLKKISINIKSTDFKLSLKFSLRFKLWGKNSTQKRFFEKFHGHVTSYHRVKTVVKQIIKIYFT